MNLVKIIQGVMPTVRDSKFHAGLSILLKRDSKAANSWGVLRFNHVSAGQSAGGATAANWGSFNKS